MGRMKKEGVSERLFLLFDRQRFEENAHLAALIRETEDRCTGALSDDMLQSVNAAGETDMSAFPPDWEDKT